MKFELYGHKRLPLEVGISWPADNKLPVDVMGIFLAAHLANKIRLVVKLPCLTLIYKYARLPVEFYALECVRRV